MKMENRESKRMTDSVRREIKKYNIMGFMYTRGSGSPYGKHKQRCFWPLGDKPMLQWNLEVGLASKYVNKVVLCSEDSKILRFGEDMKGVTIIPRPLNMTFELPRDYSSGVFKRQLPRSFFAGEPFRDPACLHYGEVGKASCIWYSCWYMEEYESYAPQIFVNLSANEPLATVETLDKLIEAFFLDEEANCAYTIYPIMPYIVSINPKTNQLFPIIFDHGLDRQSYPDIYRIGPFIVQGKPLKATFNATFRAAWITIPKEQGLDVHNEDDLILANHYLAKRLKEKEVKTD